MTTLATLATLAFGAWNFALVFGSEGWAQIAHGFAANLCFAYLVGSVIASGMDDTNQTEEDSGIDADAETRPTDTDRAGYCCNGGVDQERGCSDRG